MALLLVCCHLAPPLFKEPPPPDTAVPTKRALRQVFPKDRTCTKIFKECTFETNISRRWYISHVFFMVWALQSVWMAAGARATAGRFRALKWIVSSDWHQHMRGFTPPLLPPWHSPARFGFSNPCPGATQPSPPEKGVVSFRSFAPEQLPPAQ